jgi:dihydroorotase
MQARLQLAQNLLPSHHLAKKTPLGSASMSELSRRRFLAGSAAAVLSAPLAKPALAAMGPNDKFDLVIKGGEVLDPSQSLRGKRDVGIRWGVIEAVELGLQE